MFPPCSYNIAVNHGVAMENYIIRIYRRGEDPREVTGLVEQVEMNRQHPFACFEELREILGRGPGKAESKNLFIAQRRKDAKEDKESKIFQKV